MGNYNICIIGGGKMGQAICRGIIEKKFIFPKKSSLQPEQKPMLSIWLNFRQLFHLIILRLFKLQKL